MTPAPTRIQLSGRLAVELRGRRVEDRLPGRQGRLLFAYLVLNRVRPATREELVRALWSDEPPAAADASLSALLSRLRRALGPETLAGRGELRLVLPPEAWVDLEAAGEAVHRAESSVALAAWPQAWGPARVALAVASRRFLPGERASWIEEARDRLADVRIRALECVAQAALGLGGAELPAAERAGRALVELAPYRESGYLFLMRALAARGNVAEGLLVYDSLRRRLRDDLGTAPSAPVQELHRLLLGGGARSSR